MLEHILNKRQCFKLICGAGNEDIQEIEKLVATYALAGANFFDLSAKEDVIQAAIRGLKRVIPEDDLNNYHLCTSVGINGDPHISKASIDKLLCTDCGKCERVCNHKAILANNDQYSIDTPRCIGCRNCSQVCSSRAISFYSQDQPLDKTLPQLVNLGLSCIELHASGSNKQEIYEKWEVISRHFAGILSICLDRTYFGDLELVNHIKNLIKNRQEYTTIIQIGGTPMSGNDDRYKTTLQTVAAAQIIQSANLPVFILFSGGTNSKTTELAKLCEVKAHGVALGSYARKIIQNYTDRKDFFDNTDIFNSAVEDAKNLVNKSLIDLK